MVLRRDQISSFAIELIVGCELSRSLLFVALVFHSHVLAQTRTNSAPVSDCGDGEQRCRVKLIRTLDQLAKCHEKRDDEAPDAIAARGTQGSPIIIEYKTPTWVWVTLGTIARGEYHPRSLSGRSTIPLKARAAPYGKPYLMILLVAMRFRKDA